MKGKELRDLADDVLQKRLSDAREELMNLRFQQASGQLTDTTRMRVVRRDIARIFTEVSQRERSAKEGAK
ncbi:MAG: 50S ribosomal protein L29 [Chloroflexi bacterium]|nr:MAG: 50S ribosomal protein L29 [Chloroflexota bacterium]